MSRALVGFLSIIFCSVALIAIIAILSDSKLDGDAAKALGTAISLTLYVLTGAAGGSLGLRRPELHSVGLLLVLLSIAGFIAALFAIWPDGAGDTRWRFAFSFLVASLVGAHIALLLRSASEHLSRVAWLVRAATVVVAMLLAILLIFAIAGDEEQIGTRVVGVVAILYVLGSLLTPLIALASRRTTTGLDRKV